VSTKQILVIDDEAVVREVVQSCFEDLAGWTVITANSGQAGLEQALAKKPDAIVMDVLMPDIDGLTLLRQLKASPTTETIPVVLLTIATDFTDPGGCVSLGAVGAITKPFDPLALVEQVADWLGWSLEHREDCL
jgi:CheY-like chemotaxis protein